MNRSTRSLRRFFAREDGPTAVEYAVMLALIMVACVALVTSLGRTVSTSFSKVDTAASS